MEETENVKKPKRYLIFGIMGIVISWWSIMLFWLGFVLNWIPLVIATVGLGFSLFSMDYKNKRRTKVTVPAIVLGITAFILGIVVLIVAPIIKENWNNPVTTTTIPPVQLSFLFK